MSLTNFPEEQGSNPEQMLHDMAGTDKSVYHLTAGFTIPNVASLLTASDNQATDMLGWMFLFPKKTSGNLPLKKIKIKQLWKKVEDGKIVVFLQDFLPDDVVIPLLCRQELRTYSSEHTIDYDPALNLTKIVMTEAPEDIPIEALTYHREWAEAAFLRRSDLNFLREYLTGRTNQDYNDIFFSGSEVQYGTMHNPRLRVQQHNYRESPVSPAIYDTAYAFTLKAEPFISKPENREKPDDTVPGIRFPEPPTTDTSGGQQTTVQGSAAKAPGAFLMIPCPDFWDIVHETALEMASGDLFFSNSLAPRVGDNFSPSQFRNLLNTAEKIPLIDASLVQSAVSLIRETFGNTP